MQTHNVYENWDVKILMKPFILTKDEGFFYGGMTGGKLWNDHASIQFAVYNKFPISIDHY